MAKLKGCPSRIRICLKCGYSDRGPIASTGLCSVCSGVREGNRGRMPMVAVVREDDPRSSAQPAPPELEYHLQSRGYAGKILHHKGYH